MNELPSKSAKNKSGLCIQLGGCLSASLIPSHLRDFIGGRNLNFPNGGIANGIPKKADTVLFSAASKVKP